MRKNLQFLLAILLMFMGFQSYGQGAKKYVLYEHFTNTGCGPCAAQNPIFKQFYDANTDRAHHIAFHPWWPSSADPMYQFNVDDNTKITQYYGVSGVPDMYANGARIGSPVNASASQLDAAGASPIKIIVQQSMANDSIDITVTVLESDAVGTGNYVLRVAVVEELIQFSGAPNGETEFPNVFRTFLDYNLPIIFDGNNQTFNYKIAVDPAWKADQIYTLAYVVNSTNKKVLNSGSSLDGAIDLFTASNLNGNGEDLTYNLFLDNYSQSTVEYNISVEGEWPSEWTYDVVNNGTTYDIGRSPINVVVHTNGTGGIGRFQFTMTPMDGSDALKTSFIAVNDAKNLILTKSTPSPSTVDIVSPYVNGLEYANAEGIGYLGYDDFNKAFDAGYLANSKNIYLSIGWFFPAMDDEMVLNLQELMDNGANLMITGQDIGWDVLSNASGANGTPLQQNFMKTYLNAKYIDDGSGASTSFKIEANDPLYGGISGSNINKIYGNSYLYPDQIEPLNSNGTTFLRYSNNNVSGGYWYKGSNYKVVYLGIGPEQIVDTNVASAIIKTTKDWFDGLISSTNFESAIEANLLGNAIPNPANDFTTIKISEEYANGLQFNLYDIKGSVIMSQSITQGQNKININTSNLKDGQYFYSLTDGDRVTTKKLVIIH